MASMLRHLTPIAVVLCTAIAHVGCHRAGSGPGPGPQAGTDAADADTRGISRTTTDLRASAEALWLQRDDPQVLAQLLEELTELHLQEPQNAPLMARLSQASFLAAVQARAAHDKPGMQEALMRGMLLGEAALQTLYPAANAATEPVVDNLRKVDSAGMDALTWYVSNMGAYAASHGVTSLLFYRERVVRALTRMLEVDPTFLYSTPHRYWAIYLTRTPAFAGGSMEQARLHFERALAAAPGYFANACDYAQFYAIPMHDRPLFLRLLEPVVRGNPAEPLSAAPEQRQAQARARALLAQTETLF